MLKAQNHQNQQLCVSNSCTFKILFVLYRGKFAWAPHDKRSRQLYELKSLSLKHFFSRNWFLMTYFFVAGLISRYYKKCVRLGMISYKKKNSPIQIRPLFQYKNPTRISGKGFSVRFTVLFHYIKCSKTSGQTVLKVTSCLLMFFLPWSPIR